MVHNLDDFQLWGEYPFPNHVDPGRVFVNGHVHLEMAAVLVHVVRRGATRDCLLHRRLYPQNDWTNAGYGGKAGLGDWDVLAGSVIPELV